MMRIRTGLAICAALPLVAGPALAGGTNQPPAPEDRGASQYAPGQMKRELGPSGDSPGASGYAPGRSDYDPPGERMRKDRDLPPSGKTRDSDPSK